MEHVFLNIHRATPGISKIRSAIKKRDLPKRSITELVDDALAKNIITDSEADAIKTAEVGRLDAVQVDAFTHEEYLKNA